ncbi:MAG: endonuclease/exonuclease/phosphatase family protein [Myxococcota bacterium]
MPRCPLMLAVLATLLAGCRSDDAAPRADVVVGPDSAGIADAPDSAPAPDAPDAAPDVPPPLIAPDETPAALVLPVDDEEPPPELPDGVRVRGVTFNIHGGGDAPVEDIGAFLGTLAPDVVALQECPGDAVATIAAAAGLAHTAGTSGNVLLAATELTGVESIGLPGGRGAVRAETVIDGVPFAVYSTHISWDAAGDRQARALVDEVVAAEPLPHLVMLGDFNDEHYSTQNTILEEALVDAHTAAGWYPGQRISWPADGFDGAEGSQLIDLVWFRRDLPAIVEDVAVLDPVPLLSDHRPSLADLLFPRDAEAPFTEDPFAARRDPWRALPPDGERPPNLLENPGAEDGLAGWDVAGDALTVTERANRTPHEGAAFFVGREGSAAGVGEHSSGGQTVSLAAEADTIDAGRGRLYAAGWLTTGYKTDTEDGFTSNELTRNDHGELIVEALDAAGAVLVRVVSGPRDTYGWHPWAVAVDLPPGARAARLTWFAHQHPWNGGGNDAGFDDLYLGFSALPESHATLGGDLLANGGAESGDTGGWQAHGWQALQDLRIHGLMASLPWSWSGAHHFFGGGPLHREGGPEEDATLVQSLDLTPYAATLAEGRLALRWGGRVRTWGSQTAVTMALAIDDGDGTPWGEIAARPVAASQWTEIAQRTRIPAGAGAVRLIVRAPVTDVGTAAFADELYVWPERW